MWLFLGLLLHQPQHLSVYAAASLSDAFNEIADSLERRDPELKVDFNFAGSQVLELQLGQGAAADVFASADERWMQIARDSGFIEGTPQTFARNQLVVIVPRGNPARIGKLQDLARSGVKLVLAADAVPAGRYAREAIFRLAWSAGYPPDFSRRVLANVVSYEENVRSVASKVQLGEADAGFVYVSDVTPAVARQVRRFDLPDTANVIATYPIAVVRHATNSAAARAFIDFVLSPSGQAVLSKNRFLPGR
ncbi:MAG TPA: molybdate ABC transporter substrate-binding protein [Gemmatimonadales bacterium]|nr:molybdate ABC transporter substrate-binding protein [Gemmatimonadales bacterium]